MAKLLFVLASLVLASMLIVAYADDAATTVDYSVPPTSNDHVDPNAKDDVVNDVASSDDMGLDTQTQSSNTNYQCPAVSGRSTVACNTATTTPSSQCLGKCCLSNAECATGTCSSNFGLSQTQTCNSLDCLFSLGCFPIAPCLGLDTTCAGRTKCFNGAATCGTQNQFKTGELCLYGTKTPDWLHYSICRNPNPPASSSTGPESFVVGDPQFVGLRGQSFQIHGVADEVYNIVSDADLQYNSRFVFLDQGDCPVVNGKKQKGCFAHPGSYLGELGLKTRFGDKVHYISGSASNGFASVLVNGKQLELGETVMLQGNAGFVALNSTHMSTIHVGNWHFDFENSDMFINQRVAVTNPSKLRSHGLLGQTWKQTTYPNAIKYIQGEVDDYVIRSKEVFGDEFVYNSFN